MKKKRIMRESNGSMLHVGKISFFVQGWKKYFYRGVPLYSEIELLMNFIPKESP
jgi:hypothetical protein